MSMYNAPLYYEIALGFIDPAEQADFFEVLFKKYSKVKVKTVLDICAGPSPQLRVLAKRGYNCIALERNKKMITYLQKKAREEGITISNINADMRKFKLKQKADFACCMMDSVTYMETNQEFLDHLDCVAASLKKGGLYFIENFRLNWKPNVLFRKDTWTTKRDGIKIKTTYQLSIKDTLKQLLEERINLDVNDHGKRIIIHEIAETKQTFPEEFKLLIQLNNKFELLGFFDHFKLKKLKEGSLFNFILLRKK